MKKLLSSILLISLCTNVYAISDIELEELHKSRMAAKQKSFEQSQKVIEEEQLHWCDDNGKGLVPKYKEIFPCGSKDQHIADYNSHKISSSKAFTTLEKIHRDVMRVKTELNSLYTINMFLVGMVAFLIITRFKLGSNKRRMDIAVGKGWELGK